MKGLFLDLEMNQPSGKIIQVGFCVADLNKYEIVEKVSFIIDPEEKLNPTIVALTGITEKMIKEQAQPLSLANLTMYWNMSDYDITNTAFTWGSGDVRTFKEQVKPYSTHYLSANVCDVKKLYQSWAIANGIGIRSGLSKSMTRMGLQFKGRKHRADDDAENTAIICFELLKKFREA